MGRGRSWLRRRADRAFALFCVNLFREIFVRSLSEMSEMTDSELI
jgi:hypothetical protein